MYAEPLFLEEMKHQYWSFSLFGLGCRRNEKSGAFNSAACFEKMSFKIFRIHSSPSENAQSVRLIFNSQHLQFRSDSDQSGQLKHAKLMMPRTICFFCVRGTVSCQELNSVSRAVIEAWMPGVCESCPKGEKEGRCFPLNTDYSLTQAKIPVGHIGPFKAIEWYLGFSQFKEPCLLTPKFSMGRGQRFVEVYNRL